MVRQFAQLRAVLEKELLFFAHAVRCVLQTRLQVKGGLNRAQRGNITPLFADTAQWQGMGDISQVFANLGRGTAMGVAESAADTTTCALPADVVSMGG